MQWRSMLFPKLLKNLLVLETGAFFNGDARISALDEFSGSSFETMELDSNDRNL